MALQFLLKQPPAVVGRARTTSLEPRPGTAGLFKSLRSLSLATNITLYLPRNNILVEYVDDLRAAARSGSFRPSPPNFCLAHMYGKDGGADISALLRTSVSDQPPAYPGVANPPGRVIARPAMSVSGRTLGKRRRTAEVQEGPESLEAGMQRIEKQQSDLGASLALIQAKVDGLQQREEMSRRELHYARPVTRSISAHPEATALTEVQRLLYQMLPRLTTLEQHQQNLQQILPRLAALEQHQQELLQQRVHNTASQTSLSEQSGFAADDMQVAQSSPVPRPEQQQYHTQTLPNSPSQIASPPTHGFLLPIPNAVPHHQSASDSGRSSQPPWSELFDKRSGDDERLALLREAAGQSQQTQCWGNVDSDEEREALILHPDGDANPPILPDRGAAAAAAAGEQGWPDSTPQPPSDIFDQGSDDERLALLKEAAGQSQQQTPQHSDNVDSDELHEADLAHLHRAPARIRDGGATDAASPPSLFADLVNLLAEARTLAGRNVHTHSHLRPKLEELGRFAHAANVAAFDASRAWFRALLYVHGAAAARAATDDEPDARRLVVDVARLVAWAGDRHRACDLGVPLLRDDLVRLGAAAARAAGADVGPAGALADYERQRDVCVARVLTLSGKRGR